VNDHRLRPVPSIVKEKIINAHRGILNIPLALSCVHSLFKSYSPRVVFLNWLEKYNTHNIINPQINLPQPTSLTMHTTSSSSQPTAADWEAAKPHIERLYRHEEKKLSEVMFIMARDYNHRAT